MSKTLSSSDRIESTRKILNPPTSKLADLEAAGAVLNHVLAETDAEIEEMASRRKTLVSSDTTAAEIDKALERHDEAVRTLTRRNEIATVVVTKLNERIATEREAENSTKRRAEYDEALALHATATKRVKEFLDRAGAEAREVLRLYAESEIKTAAVNGGLPPGALPIPSVEAERRGPLGSQKTTVREFCGFADGRRLIGEKGHVEATEREDGKLDVFVPGGSTGAGDYFVCALENFVETFTESDTMPWPENLANSLSIPAFHVAEPPRWRAIAADRGPVFPDQIAAEIDSLESQPPYRFEPRVETRVMTLAAWRRLNGEAVEVEPAPVAVAAD
jgi:hypothetical protein